MRQLRLIVVGATIGAICGSVVLRPNDDLRPVAIATAAGAILLGLTFALQRFASRAGPHLAPAHASLIGRAVVSLAAALSVVLTFNMLVASDARSVPAHPNAQTTVGPMRAAPSPIAAPIAPASSAGPAVPVVPASPQPAVHPPAAAEPTSSTPRATLLPASSPAATPQPATPQPTPVSSPPSIIPTLPPLPTLPVGLP